MTFAEYKVQRELIIRTGEALARSIGHNHRCPKVSPAVPCTCGEGAKQAKALDDWMHLVEEIKSGS